MRVKTNKKDIERLIHLPLRLCQRQCGRFGIVQLI